jgi:flavin-dependent dehydrogenase
MSNAGADVIVLGGGLAGLSAALQLKQQRPRTRVVCVEKHTYPVPEAAFKVGESAAELGSHYLKHTIGFERHMETEQLRKFSMRIFSPAAGNNDIALRPEIGFHRPAPLRTYQIDRGRLENALAAAAQEAGVELVPGHTVTGFELGSDSHAVTVRNGAPREYRARWIVDATGRAGVLRRGLGLGVEIDHDVSAAWFRVAERIPVDEWSGDAAWHARVPNRKRWLSTVHLVGEGYWVWLIPLASGGHSVGVVADGAFVPFERIRRYDALLAFLGEVEPQLAAALPPREDGLQDFRKLKNYAYATRRGLSPRRWCLTGEAGLFLDPLYATGLDFIAVANTLATRLILAELDGESGPDFGRRLKAYNRTYLGQFMGWEPAFAGQYEVFRDGVVTAAKVSWDNLGYFMFPVPLFNSDLLDDHAFVDEMREVFKPHFRMNLYMQQRFRELCRDGFELEQAGFARISDAFLEQIFAAASGEMTRAQVASAIRDNVRRLEAVGAAMLERLCEAAGCPVEAPPWPVDPGARREAADVIAWSPYAQRTAPPAAREPQPAGTYMLR